MNRPLVLTARLDNAAQAHFNALRQAHFPPERNFLKAHLTMFHALPGDRKDNIVRTLAEIAKQPPMAARVSGPRFLGRGVAFRIDCPALNSLRAELTARWRPWLTPQDSQGWQAHVTIQNKVAPDVARALYDRLQAEFVEQPLTLQGLDLWHYAGGPWDAADAFDFAKT